LSGRYKILVVEDDVLIAMELEERLGEMGYEVLGPAHTLEAAAEQIAAQRPDAALLDANLNGRSSVELGAALAEQGVPVAFCTGYDALKGAPPSLANAPVLIKPIPDTTLKATLQQMLGG
jgi:DNA-binding response OmpR family regulator